MALKKCKECGNEFSTKAESCPKCGAVLKKKTSGCVGCLTVVIVGVVVLFAIVLSKDTRPSGGAGIGASGPGTQVQKSSDSTNPSSEKEHSVTKPATPTVVNPEKAVAEAKASLEKARTAALQKLEAWADYRKAKEDLESARQRMVEASKTDGNPDLTGAMQDYSAASNTISDMTKEAENSADVRAAEQRLAKALADAPGTPSHVESEVRKALRESNRNVGRVSKVQIEGTVIEVYFSINDNLTDGLVKRGARRDVVEILKAIQQSGYPYSEVTVLGTFPMQDKFGNSWEWKVVEATYERSTVDRINWDGFLTENIYSIADGGRIHRAFE